MAILFLLHHGQLAEPFKYNFRVFLLLLFLGDIQEATWHLMSATCLSVTREMKEGCNGICTRYVSPFPQLSQSSSQLPPIEIDIGLQLGSNISFLTLSNFPRKIMFHRCASKKSLCLLQTTIPIKNYSLPVTPCPIIILVESGRHKAYVPIDQKIPSIVK